PQVLSSIFSAFANENYPAITAFRGRYSWQPDLNRKISFSKKNFPKETSGQAHEVPQGDDLKAFFFKNYKLKKGATYLITGGLGGIGLTIAAYLSQQYQARIILVSRKNLPENSEIIR